jgi:hypothetical protein
VNSGVNSEDQLGHEREGKWKQATTGLNTRISLGDC